HVRSLDTGEDEAQTVGPGKGQAIFLPLDTGPGNAGSLDGKRGGLAYLCRLVGNRTGPGHLRRGVGIDGQRADIRSVPEIAFRPLHIEYRSTDVANRSVMVKFGQLSAAAN